MAPLARARSTGTLLIADQAEVSRRGAIRIIDRSASSARVMDSIQPRQGNSSTGASWGVSSGSDVLKLASQTGPACTW